MNANDDDTIGKFESENDELLEAPDEGCAEAGDENVSGQQAAPEPAGEEPDSETRCAELQDKYVRLMAEFDNFRRRTAREYDQRMELSNEKIISEMVEVRDNFERALKSGKQNPDFPAYYEGTKLIFDKFDTILGRHGLEPFGEVGDEFTPELYDALMKVPNPDVPADYITDVFEKGYRLKNKVIKHGRVIVSSGKPEHAPSSDSPDTNQEQAAAEAA